MVGKLVYSRVLQNRLKKDQTPTQTSIEQGHQQQFYSSQSEDRPVVDSRPRDSRPYDNRPRDNRSRGNRPHDNRPRINRSHDQRPAADYRQRDNHSADDRGADGNKIRRGPGRRLAKEKEKRTRGMDPALSQKYASLPESMQEKVNATIEICYQQHMANLYKNPAAAEQDDTHYDSDVEIDTESDTF